MGKFLRGFKVTVAGALDESVYFTKEKPNYVSVEVPATENLPVGRIVFVVFVPQNGYSKGETMQVPVERVISIATDGGAA